MINISQRATVYKTVARLADAGLIEVRQTERDQQYPERTVYELTDAGREVMRDWLAEMLAGGDREYPEFPAALSFIMLLTPDEALPLLDHRREQTAARLAELDAAIAEPPVAMLEVRYLCAIADAELAWVTQTVGELKNKRLDWAEAQLRAFADAHTHEIV